MDKRTLAVATAALLVGAAALAQGERADILELVNGTVVAFASSEYGGWEAKYLLDGLTKRGWCSEEGKPLPHAIVLELAQPYTVTGVAVDTTGDQEPGYPGISAKTVVVYGSTSSATGGFSELATVRVPKGGRGEATLAKPAVARWLKYEVSANWGNADYTEIMELEAYGTPFGPAPSVNVTGVYDSDYGPMRLQQDGGLVRGCYYDGAAQIDGSVKGRVLQAEWRQDEGKRVGAVIMVVSPDGSALNGVWFEHGALAGEWSGKKANVEANCTLAKEGGLAQRLSSGGRAVLYGIYFDSDSATLKPESQATLDEVLAVLKAKPALRLQVGGHTDATNTDAHNLQLSQRRAEAVVKWLVEHGVAAGRLTAKGFGKAQPVADNATGAGRALNRRVEVTALK